MYWCDDVLFSYALPVLYILHSFHLTIYLSNGPKSAYKWCLHFFNNWRAHGYFIIHWTSSLVIDTWVVPNLRLLQIVLPQVTSCRQRFPGSWADLQDGALEMHVLVIFIDGDKLPYPEDALIAVVVVQSRTGRVLLPGFLPGVGKRRVSWQKASAWFLNNLP